MATCNICKYAGTPSYKSPCSECKGFSKYEYEKHQTNADRIRAMSDEELANIMAGTPICKERYMDCIKDGRDCEPCLLEWLKQPAEE